MQRNNIHPPAIQHRQKPGFTLIELLVAIGIIGLLTVIIFQALRPTGTAARAAATRTTILKVTALLDQYKEDIKRGDGDPVALRQTTARSNAAGVEIPGEVAVVFARKVQMKKLIPQRAEDVFARLAGQDTASSAPPSYDRLASEKDALSLKAESAELLYALLTGGKFKVLEGGSEKAVEIGNVSLGSENSSASAFKANELADTDGDGQLELVDGWGEPLRFYRWPTRLIRPNGGTNPTNPNDILKTVMSNVPKRTTLGKDPDDPLDDLTRYDAIMGRGGQNRNTYDDLSEANYHTPDTYHAFLVISAGPDKKLGLEEPADSSNFGFLAQPLSSVLSTPLDSELNDNITNLQEDLSK